MKKIDIAEINKWYAANYEKGLEGRRLTLDQIKPYLAGLDDPFDVIKIGESFENRDIYKLSIGTGSKKILLWTQMHGNESTTTKAIFDLLNVLCNDNNTSESILKTCTIKIIPILNPDGAKAFTRLNTNQIDLNRDAQNLSQPESLVLRKCFDSFKPNYCFNLHGQRTIYSAGKTHNPATISFLASAQDEIQKRENVD